MFSELAAAIAGLRAEVEASKKNYESLCDMVKTFADETRRNIDSIAAAQATSFDNFRKERTPNLGFIVSSASVMVLLFGGTFGFAWTNSEKNDDLQMNLYNEIVEELHDTGVIQGQVVEKTIGIREDVERVIGLLVENEKTTARNETNIEWLRSWVASVDENSLQRHVDGNERADRASARVREMLMDLRSRIDTTDERNWIKSNEEQEGLRLQRNHNANKRFDTMEDLVTELRKQLYEAKQNSAQQAQ